MTRFPFRFDARYRPFLASLGVLPQTAYVDVGDRILVVRFGPWTLVTPRSNVAEVTVSGPYRWWRAIGPRLSLADRGVTFGTSTSGGVCVTFHQPVKGLEPVGLLRHPGMTVTVEDTDGLAATLGKHT